MPVVLPAQRRAALAPSAVIGTACVIAGGLVAAATAPAPSEKGAWLAAYLVLVGGVAQIALATGHAAFGGPGSARTTGLHVAGWNAGNALVVAGTLSAVTAVADVGGVLLVVALAVLVPGLRAPSAGLPAGGRWLLYGYRVVVVVLLVSIPVGLVLAALRA